ncbi:MAG: hypothetical protein P4L84_04915 [Isosphaeraceae bacterium]|nr:hypothetical protein [Isosphaeraceae bacterium]
MGDPRCKWVRGRLPLSAGDELFGTERRRVERHLIRCAQCRAHQAALANALEVLHAASGEPPARPDAPSLWPALARQIQESRRPAPASPWAFARHWPRLALAAALLVALGVTATVRRQGVEARAQIADAGRPLPVLLPVAQSVPVPAAPAPASERVAQTDPAPETAPAARYDYMLDHGTPMGPDGADSKTRPSY